MSDIVLLLGPVAFQDFEVPSGIIFGGSQRLAVHRPVGCPRIIDVLGREETLITFAGTFSGSDATWRARTLDGLRTAGLPLPLTWDIFFYTVILSGFRADYRSGWWIPYRITCTVLRDEAAELLSSLPSLAASVLGDVSTASQQVSMAGVDLSTVQSACAMPNASVYGTNDYASAQASLTGAQLTMNVATTGAETALLTSDPSLSSSAEDGAVRLLGATDAAGQLSGLAAGRAYVARASANLANAGT